MKTDLISRRSFLSVVGAVGAAAALTACGGSSSTASSAASSTAASSEAASAVAKLDKVKVAVPNDTTNEARALLLLQDNGVIKLADGAGLATTVKDIVENPHNVKIQELEAAQVSRVKDEVAFVVLNGNYALQAGLHASDALAIEDASGDAAQTYANLLVVEEGNENEPAIKALVAALTSQTVKDYIDSTYNGAVVAIF